MLRPERMSRVSITGSKAVMDDVINTTHDLNIVDLANYDDGWEDFEPGNPMEGADSTAGKLVTVRSLKSILDIEESDAGPERIIYDEDLETELERVREEVNALDDRRNDLNDERRSLNERIDAMAPFERLGIDLDLLSGYDSLETLVGEGNRKEINRALAESESVASHEIMGNDDGMAIFVYPTDGKRNILENALVGTEFTASEIPDGEGSPNAYVSDLQKRRNELNSELETIEEKLTAQRHESSGFLLSAEEHLAIKLQKQEAPLSFATTRNAFVAEGWIPTQRFVDLVEALEAEVGEHCAVEELERADYSTEGHATDTEPVERGGGEGTGTPETATDGGANVPETASDEDIDNQELRPDGGTADHDQPIAESEPPVIQDNPGPVQPFEILTKLVNRPLYAEFDPTLIFFLTFPALFGFMIGDLGYGLLYFAISYGAYSRLDSVGGRAIGAIGMWAGAFTMLFGVLYGEIFGLHQLGEFVWNGHPPIHKGLQPEYLNYAQLWIAVSMLFGLMHLTIGYVIDFVETSLEHSVSGAIFETGSWLVMMLGLWTWIFSTHKERVKPDFLFAVFNGQPFAFGFAGLPETVGLAGIGVLLIGAVLLAIGDPLEIIEGLQVLVNVLSYSRLAAVVLAKAGLAFVVNLLVFGAYTEGPPGEEAFHFLFFSQRYASASEVPANDLMFSGLLNGEGVMLVIGAIIGAIILIFGHILVLALGLTSAGLQAIRLEYVEFLSKSRDYDGGGNVYEPFGHERKYTSDPKNQQKHQ